MFDFHKKIDLIIVTHIENKIIRHLVKSIFLSLFQLEWQQLYDIFNWISTNFSQRV